MKIAGKIILIIFILLFVTSLTIFLINLFQGDKLISVENIKTSIENIFF